MLTDKTIDKFSARYWCVFNNQGFNEILKGLKSEGKIKSVGDIDKVTQDIKTESDGYFEAMGLTPLYEGSAADATTGVLDTMEAFGMKPVDRSATAAKTAHLDATDLSDKELKANAERVDALKKEFGSDSRGFKHEWMKRIRQDPSKWAVKNTKGYHVDGDTEFEHTVDGVTQKTTMNELSKKISNEGVGKDVESGLKGFFGNALAWITSIGGLIAVATIVYKTMPYWSQKIKYAFKKLRSSNSVACCEFEGADETKYRAWFDLKRNAWYLGYQSAGMFRQKSFPSREDVDSFFETNFFKRFCGRCAENMNAVLGNDAVVNAVKAAGQKDRDLLTIVEDLSKKRDVIEQNMAGGVHKYQD